MSSPAEIYVALIVVSLVAFVPFFVRLLSKRRNVEALRQVELVVFSDDPMVRALIDRSLCSHCAKCSFTDLGSLSCEDLRLGRRARAMVIVDTRTSGHANQVAEMVRPGSSVLVLVPIRARRARRILHEKGISVCSRTPNTEGLRQALLDLLEE